MQSSLFNKNARQQLHTLLPNFPGPFGGVARARSHHFETCLRFLQTLENLVTCEALQCVKQLPQPDAIGGELLILIDEVSCAIKARFNFELCRLTGYFYD